MLLRQFVKGQNPEGGGKRFIVDWPLKYAKHAAQALGIPFSGPKKLAQGKPRRIDGRAFWRFVNEHSVCEIKAAASSGEASQAQNLVFLIRGQCDTIEQWQQTLQEGLGLPVSIKSVN